MERATKAWSQRVLEPPAAKRTGGRQWPMRTEIFSSAHAMANLVSANPLSNDAVNRRGRLLQKRQSTPWGFVPLYSSLRGSGGWPLQTESPRRKKATHNQPRFSHAPEAKQRQSHPQ